MQKDRDAEFRRGIEVGRQRGNRACRQKTREAQEQIDIEDEMQRGRDA